ncbi:MAG: F0F1 ATP synthase subunit beta, partial [Actinomycetia bacterium]|nr:F0F1 ATP synthase subunit beta [Actinomycetes bacterium]
MSVTTLATGRIVKVAGPVIDVEFPPDALPEINYAIEVDLEVQGVTSTLICEVAQQLGNDRIRAIAFAPTDGLVRGAAVRNTGAPISVPVGDQTLGHIFNMWGVALDDPDLE